MSSARRVTMTQAETSGSTENRSRSPVPARAGTPVSGRRRSHSPLMAADARPGTRP
jgi:hypothetical protein